MNRLKNFEILISCCKTTTGFTDTAIGLGYLFLMFSYELVSSPVQKKTSKKTLTAF